MHYYYTRWYFEGDDGLDKGIYHSTWESPEPPAKFLASCDADGLLEYRRFTDLEAMNKFAASVGLVAFNAEPA